MTPFYVLFLFKRTPCNVGPVSEDSLEVHSLYQKPESQRKTLSSTFLSTTGTLLSFIYINYLNILNLFSVVALLTQWFASVELVIAHKTYQNKKKTKKAPKKQKTERR